MAKKLFLGTLFVCAAWIILDLVIHNIILSSQYAATPNLWRPEAEMKPVLMIIVVIISALVFVYIYAGFVANKSMNTAVKYGVVFGIGVGISMGYGSYAFMPITYLTALGWFLGTLVETTVGGILLGLFVKD